MDKRLAKRHKRQVLRAREKVKISLPDVRTQEEIEAAREASRPMDTHPWPVLHSTPAEHVEPVEPAEPVPAEPVPTE
jgi:hypothetical protein